MDASTKTAHSAALTCTRATRVHTDQHSARPPHARISACQSSSPRRSCPVSKRPWHRCRSQPVRDRGAHVPARQAWSLARGQTSLRQSRPPRLLPQPARRAIGQDQLQRTRPTRSAPSTHAEARVPAERACKAGCSCAHRHAAGIRQMRLRSGLRRPTVLYSVHERRPAALGARVVQLLRSTRVPGDGVSPAQELRHLPGRGERPKREREDRHHRGTHG